MSGNSASSALTGGSVTTDTALGTLTTGENQHPLTNFFGPTAGHHEALRADDRLSHETYNLPRAYVGKNKYLEETLDFMIRKEDEFYTRSLLPWEYTDELHIAWEIFSFNRTLADLEPHQGLPRFVTQESEKHSDNLLRRGLAFIIEHGFYKTERGKRHFALNLQQITDAVHTTCYFGVIHALLGGKSYYREWRRKFGRQVNRRNDLFREERKRWAIVQKSRDGLYLLDAELKHELKREGVVPSLWVFPDKMGIYIHMVSGDALSYKERGPEAVTNRESGDKIASFRGLPVFEAQSFDVEFTSEPVDLMVRERQCGEFFYLPKYKEGTTSGDADGEISIYSADADKFERIKYSDVIVNTDDETGMIFGDSNTATNGENGTTAKKGGKARDGYLLFRPFQTYRMASAILAKGGNELGSTFHGHHDFMLSDDILRKVHVGHYTFYSKSVVKRPKNYIIVEDIFSQGYVGGEGTRIFTRSEFKDAVSENTLGKSGPSIIAVSTSKEPVGDVLDITGRFQQSVYDIFNEADAQEEHYANSGKAYQALALGMLEPYRNNINDEYIMRVQRYNTVCFRGMQYDNDGKDGAMILTQLNTGHWGPNVYAGVRKVREGEMAFMKQCDHTAVTSV